MVFTQSKESDRDLSIITSRAGSRLQALGSGEVKLISIFWCGSFAFGISAGDTPPFAVEPRAGWCGLAVVSQVLRYLGRLRNVSGLKGSHIWPDLVLQRLLVDVPSFIWFIIEAQHTIPRKLLNWHFVSPLLTFTEICIYAMCKTYSHTSYPRVLTKPPSHSSRERGFKLKW